MVGRVGDRVAAFWDAQAPYFDDEPDHGLRDASARRAWTDRLSTWLPQPPADVVDLGCGTATLSTLLAQQGFRLTGVDLSEVMIHHARAKTAAAGMDIQFHHGDAAAPPMAPGSVDVVLVRHLLWTLPDPYRALIVWAQLLRPGGRLVLIEGCWDQDDTDDGDDEQVRGAMPWFGGVDAETLATAVRPLSTLVTVHDLSSDESLWGRPVDDERFALVAQVG